MKKVEKKREIMRFMRKFIGELGCRCLLSEL